MKIEEERGHIVNSEAGKDLLDESGMMERNVIGKWRLEEKLRVRSGRL